MSIAVRRPELFATRRSRTVGYGVTVAAAAGAGAMLSWAEPTGLSTADAFWSAALVAVAALFGATARRWTWFLPAGVAAVLAGDGVAAACAAVAIVVAFVSVLRDSRSRARGAFVVGLGAIALLRTEPIGFHGLTAILTVAALAPAVVSGYGNAGRRVQRRVRRVGLVGAGILALMLAGAVLGLVSVMGDIAEGGRAIDGGLAAAREADDDTAAEELSLAARSLAAADKTLSSWFVAPATTLPVIGPNMHAVGSLSAQASDVAEVTSLAATNADVDSLQLVDGRLDPAAVAAMSEPLQQVRSALDRMDRSVDEARSPWLLAPVTTRIDRLDQQVAEAVPDADAAITAVSAAPTLLGADGAKRYLVLFTTPVEARGRFGFPGNFAEIVLDDGKLSMPRFGRVAELEQDGVPGPERSLTAPPDLVSRYDRFDVAGTWRNLTMTPDLLSLAIAAGELYPQSGGVPIDGVMAVDPVGLAAIMRFTGDVEIEGLDTPLTSENAARFLMFEQYQAFGSNADRVDALSDVAHETFDRAHPREPAGAADPERPLRPDRRRRPHRLRHPQPAHVRPALHDGRHRQLRRAQGRDRLGHADHRQRRRQQDRPLPQPPGELRRPLGPGHRPGHQHPHGHAGEHGAALRAARLRDRQRRRAPVGDQPLVRVDVQPVRAGGGAAGRRARRRPSGDRAGPQRVLDLRRHPAGRLGAAPARPGRAWSRAPTGSTRPSSRSPTPTTSR